MTTTAHIVSQPALGRDLLINQYDEVSDIVEYGQGAAALKLHERILSSNERRRYTDAARAVAALTALPGYREAECDEHGNGYTADIYPEA